MSDDRVAGAPWCPEAAAHKPGPLLGSARKVNT